LKMYCYLILTLPIAIVEQFCTAYLQIPPLPVALEVLLARLGHTELELDLVWELVLVPGQDLELVLVLALESQKL